MTDPSTYAVDALSESWLPLAQCGDCEWVGRGEKIRHEARQHTGDTGHTTRVDRVTSITFIGEERRKR